MPATSRLLAACLASLALSPALVRAEDPPASLVPEPAEAPTTGDPAPPPAQEAPRSPARPDRALALSLGLGYVAADPKNGQEVKGTASSGLWAGADYAFRASRWFSPRLYAGVGVASGGSDCGAGVAPCELTAEYVYAGGKIRLLAPIPWVAPFLELGLGLSAGHFATRVGGSYDKVENGLTYHVPWALGLALGPRRQVELSVWFMHHPALSQSSGGLMVGYRFGLD